VSNPPCSVPFDINKWWNAYMNFGVSYTDNQADYGDGKVVDVQAGSYNIFQQHTFSLGKKWKGEIFWWYIKRFGGTSKIFRKRSKKESISRKISGKRPTEKFFQKQERIQIRAIIVIYLRG
jgi:hypothetical protein